MDNRLSGTVSILGTKLEEGPYADHLGLIKYSAERSRKELRTKDGRIVTRSKFLSLTKSHAACSARVFEA
jgi:hypothetical protein